ncbi:Methenyltetrahydrofolate cyclohydrolase [Planctomycetes bacterium Poly30]|uniref:Formimidoyltransferase-cyclodeaminase n=1 Tax=Saltatorellus ferox TaxID=2528018 RepID=A0A518ERU1_9BACT|nr:Methenyltetrahydrofolate cyclohydrolase [Planctomycetes bacterium Poly30]
MAQLIECVPNFSEGRDQSVLDAIAAAVRAVDGVTLLDVDPGKATNRTVFTFVGEPGPVIEAAVQAARVGAERIDMSKHSGEHPRFGGMDVCPLVPISGITMEETVVHARALAKRLGEEVGLSIYCYESAALKPNRKNLAVVRAGEYEGLAARIGTDEWKPDFGPAKFQPRTGATAVGARDFLVAYNVNLNTTSSRRANAIAYDVREKGRVKREPDPVTGKVVLDEKGQEVWTPGMLRACKGIGWFIEEYGIAQISMNLTDLSVTPVHVAFDACVERAAVRGIRVTGSEIVGLVPLKVLLDAGRHYLAKQERSLGVSDAELIKIAVRTLGLDELTPFDPKTRVIEYAIQASGQKRLIDMSLEALVHETASESPAPGGGSIAAATGAFGAALGTMVANLSSHKRGWDDRWKEFSDVAVIGKACHDRLLALVDEDTAAFNRIMDAWRADESHRAAAIEEATKYAIEVPLQVMATALEAMHVCEAMVERGMEASLSDAAVGALCLETAVRGAALNVAINAKDLKDEAAKAHYVSEAKKMEADARTRCEAVQTSVRKRL